MSIIRFRDIDVVRHPLVGRIVKAYDAEYEKPEPAADAAETTN